MSGSTTETGGIISEAQVEEIIQRYLGKISLKAWGLMLANIAALLVGLFSIYGWKKDLEYALKELTPMPAKVLAIEKWQGDRVSQGLKWSEEIAVLKAHDEAQQLILVQLLQGQARIEALLGKDKQK